MKARKKRGEWTKAGLILYIVLLVQFYWQPVGLAEKVDVATKVRKEHEPPGNELFEGARKLTRSPIVQESSERGRDLDDLSLEMKILDLDDNVVFGGMVLSLMEGEAWTANQHGIVSLSREEAKRKAPFLVVGFNCFSQELSVLPTVVKLTRGGNFVGRVVDSETGVGIARVSVFPYKGIAGTGRNAFRSVTAHWQGVKTGIHGCFELSVAFPFGENNQIEIVLPSGRAQIIKLEYSELALDIETGGVKIPIALLPATSQY